MTVWQNGKFVSYLRVSTDQQGRSGLGSEAQRKTVADFLKFVETESGAKEDRPKLADALALARAHGAKLVINSLEGHWPL